MADEGYVGRRIALKAYHVKQARHKASGRLNERKDDEEEQELIRQKLLEEDLLFDKYTKVRTRLGFRVRVSDKYTKVRTRLDP